MAKNVQNKPLKEVLILAYSFPPVGGIRAKRVLKFIKYLRDFGWEPVVLTVRKPVVPIYDYELLKEVPANIKVIRTHSLEPGNKFKDYLKGNENLGKGIGIFSQIFYNICNKVRWLIFIPDPRIGWVPFAISRGLLVIRQKKIDAILAIGEPFSSFITGFLLKKLTKKPLVLDFRDEWSEFNEYFFPGKGKVVRAIERKLEELVINNSDKVISVTESIVDNFRKRYAKHKDKFVCITNGFDPDDFKNIERKKSKKFTITYAGSLYRLRSPEFFFKALVDFLTKNPDAVDDIEIIFIGTVEPDIKYLFDNCAIKNIVTFVGFVKYNDALKYLANSDILLYIEDQVKIAYRFLPAKLFDYIGVGRPILALANNGTVKDTIQQIGCGMVVPSQDIQMISDALNDLYNKFKIGELKTEVNPIIARKFERRELTKELSEVLYSVVR